MRTISTTDPARLRPLALLDGLSDAQLGQLAEAGETVGFDVGDELFRQGAPAEFWWLLLDGCIELRRRTGHEESTVGTMNTPGQWAGGFRAWDPHGVYMATGRVRQAGHLMRVPAEALLALGRSWFPFGLHMINGLVQTVRAIESIARQRESLVALGTLAAGLAHELNNPAAATTRAVDALIGAGDDLFGALRRLATSGVRTDQFAALDALRAGSASSTRSRTPLQIADLEDELTGWLQDRRIDRDWVIAPALAAAGLDVDRCEQVAAALDERSLGAGLEWVAQSVTIAALLAEIKESTRRISDLVTAVKDYSHLDRSAIGDVLVADGLDSTLTMLSHELTGVTVVREYDPQAPIVEANTAELNQVWTHLIRNAVDAMRGTGTLRVSVVPNGDGVRVNIADSGPGMVPEVRVHAFDPFFTTKGVGGGTGLGLDVSRRIVEQHGGRIWIDSDPSGTILRVHLPVRGAAQAT